MSLQSYLNGYELPADVVEFIHEHRLISICTALMIFIIAQIVVAELSLHSNICNNDPYVDEWIYYFISSTTGVNFILCIICSLSSVNRYEKENSFLFTCTGMTNIFNLISNILVLSNIGGVCIDALGVHTFGPQWIPFIINQLFLLYMAYGLNDISTIDLPTKLTKYRIHVIIYFFFLFFCFPFYSEAPMGLAIFIAVICSCYIIYLVLDSCGLMSVKKLSTLVMFLNAVRKKCMKNTSSYYNKNIRQNNSRITSLNRGESRRNLENLANNILKEQIRRKKEEEKQKKADVEESNNNINTINNIMTEGDQNIKYYLVWFLRIGLLRYPLFYLFGAVSIYNENGTLFLQILFNFMDVVVMTICLFVSFATSRYQAFTKLQEEMIATVKRRSHLRMVFHDVRGPLSNVIMGLELLFSNEQFLKLFVIGNDDDNNYDIEDTGVDLDTVETLEDMKVAAEDCMSTLNHCLDMEKIESEATAKLLFNDFEVPQLVEKVKRQYQITAHKKNITIKTEVMEGLDCTLSGDQFKIQHVLMNLLSNSIKYSPPNTTITIHVESSPGDASDSPRQAEENRFRMRPDSAHQTLNISPPSPARSSSSGTHSYQTAMQLRSTSQIIVQGSNPTHSQEKQQHEQQQSSSSPRSPAKTSKGSLTTGFQSFLPRVMNTFNSHPNYNNDTEAGTGPSIDVRESGSHGGVVNVTFKVIDQGQGMSAEEQTKLFQPFMQGKHKIKQTVESTGLGLAQCKRNVELHNGKIGCISTQDGPDHGTTFWFRVPFKVSDHPDHCRRSLALNKREKKLFYSDKIVGEEQYNENEDFSISHPEPSDRVVAGAAEVMSMSETQRSQMSNDSRSRSGSVVVVNNLNNNNIADYDDARLCRTGSDVSVSSSVSRCSSAPSLDSTRAKGSDVTKGVGVGGGGNSENNRNDLSIIPQMSDRSGSVDQYTNRSIDTGRTIDSLQPSGSSGGCTQFSTQLTVLLVDDEKTAKKLLKNFLKKRNVDVETADNGILALEVYHKYPPDHFHIIFTDGHMPEMDGLQLCSKLRADRYPHMLVGLTGDSFEEELNKFLYNGADLVVSKPLDPKKLDGLVAHIEANGYLHNQDKKYVFIGNSVQLKVLDANMLRRSRSNSSVDSDQTNGTYNNRSVSPGGRSGQQQLQQAGPLNLQSSSITMNHNNSNNTNDELSINNSNKSALGRLTQSIKTGSSSSSSSSSQIRHASLDSSEYCIGGENDPSSSSSQKWPISLRPFTRSPSADRGSTSDVFGINAASLKEPTSTRSLDSPHLFHLQHIIPSTGSGSSLGSGSGGRTKSAEGSRGGSPANRKRSASTNNVDNLMNSVLNIFPSQYRATPRSSSKITTSNSSDSILNLGVKDNQLSYGNNHNKSDDNIDNTSLADDHNGFNPVDHSSSHLTTGLSNTTDTEIPRKTGKSITFPSAIIKSNSDNESTVIDSRQDNIKSISHGSRLFSASLEKDIVAHLEGPLDCRGSSLQMRSSRKKYLLSGVDLSERGSYSSIEGDYIHAATLPRLESGVPYYGNGDDDDDDDNDDENNNKNLPYSSFVPSSSIALYGLSHVQGGKAEGEGNDDDDQGSSTLGSPLTPYSPNKPS